MLTKKQILWAECILRTSQDGIPRHVTEDGRIMKYDWELSEELSDPHALPDHVLRMLQAVAKSTSTLD